MQAVGIHAWAFNFELNQSDVTLTQGDGKLLVSLAGPGQVGQRLVVATIRLRRSTFQLFDGSQEKGYPPAVTILPKSDLDGQGLVPNGTTPQDVHSGLWTSVEFPHFSYYRHVATKLYFKFGYADNNEAIFVKAEIPLEASLDVFLITTDPGQHFSFT